MQPVRRKQRKHPRHGRLFVLLAVLLALLGACAGVLYMNARVQEPIEEEPSTYGELASYAEEDVMNVAVTLASGEAWTITRKDAGFTANGSDSVISPLMQSGILAAVNAVHYEMILSENPDEFQDELSELGMDAPLVATVSYSDGSVWTVRIGNPSALEEDNWRYMTVDGDDRLFAVDKGTWESLNLSNTELYDVEQPVIHKARIDRIVFAGADGNTLASWELQGEVTDGHAADNWMMTAPYRYRADADTMDGIRRNLANIVLGSFVADESTETDAEYGFEKPRFVLTIHQQAAALSTASGGSTSVAYSEYPESTIVLTVGGMKNDYVYYVKYKSRIFTMSAFTLDTFIKLDLMSTVSRYPVSAALSSIKELTVTNASGTETYELTHTERTDESGNVLTDDDGAAIIDSTCTLNGTAISYDAFEAAYIRLETVTVSGTLPDGWTPSGDAHTVYTFTAGDGTQRTVALYDYDALHDAVSADGTMLFYLVKDGFVLDFSEQ